MGLKNYHLSGLVADVWLEHARVVEKYITEKQLSPDTEVLQFRAAKPEVAEKMSGEQAYADWQLKQGGIRVPHLHYKGELYLLNKKQWNEFSGEILKEFSKKLAETKTVNFGQLMDISETMNEII